MAARSKDGRSAGAGARWSGSGGSLAAHWMSSHAARRSMGWQESLTFDPDPPPEVQEAILANHYQEVILDDPPFSINIVPQLPDDDNGEGIQSIPCMRKELLQKNLDMIRGSRANKRRHT